MKTISYSVTEEKLEEIKQYSEGMGLTPSTLSRHAVYQYMKRYKQNSIQTHKDK